MFSLRSAAMGLAAVVVVSTAVRAQPPAPGPTTQILVTLTIRPDVDRAQVLKELPEEVRATVRLYLDGKIQQWYSRADGKGVIFILNAATVADAKAAMEPLPLAKASLATFDYVALAPLSPLRVLLADR